ncbi:hypothetical protein CFAM422_003796 [Trichoderma lentiforme]|uniref:Uncharacterized protein n=1 Tax=Trichoderma lentiforme TaxID=1567552 RepID=A0A9P4XLX5_9HYPO|nr:hypothetical protein CFAM422_003796 [Trichoderma lentiforme]
MTDAQCPDLEALIVRKFNSLRVVLDQDAAGNGRINAVFIHLEWLYLLNFGGDDITGGSHHIFFSKFEF